MSSLPSSRNPGLEAGKSSVKNTLMSVPGNLGRASWHFNGKVPSHSFELHGSLHLLDLDSCQCPYLSSCRSEIHMAGTLRLKSVLYVFSIREQNQYTESRDFADWIYPLL